MSDPIFKEFPAGFFVKYNIHCALCRDEVSGWRILACHGSGEHRTLRPDRGEVSGYADCGRKKDHGPHTYAVKCECLGHNPEVAAYHERMQDHRRAKATK